MSTYLKKYYLDDRKLAQRALLEFHRALKSERMIAFTGAMTTEAFGYPDWAGLINEFKLEAEDIFSSCSDGSDGNNCEICSKYFGLPFQPQLIADRINSFFGDKLDPRVGVSLIGELADQLDKSHRGRDNQRGNGSQSGRDNQNKTRKNKIEEALSELARKPGCEPIEKANSINSLWKDLGIHRFATLNYDLELEKMLMLTGSDHKAEAPEDNKKTTYDILKRLKETPHSGLTWSDNSSRIRRILANGRTVESDVVSRKRLDRLIDFAMGSIDAEQHILHLHGRCDDPESMVFSYRDYDKLYRRNDMHRQPFEYGHRIMTGGNPILFVGLGMGEAEINRTLEDFISNTPYHRTAPTFLLWNVGTWDKVQRAAFRMDKLHRLGILTIFDTDVLDPRENSKLKDANKEPKLILQNLQLLISSVAKTAAIIGQRESYIGLRWRSMETKIQSDLGTSRLTKLWGVTPSSIKIIDKNITSERKKLITGLTQLDCRLPIFAIASAGWGKGQLSSIIAQQLVSDTSSYVMQANAGFCFDTDSFLDTIARFLSKLIITDEENGEKSFSKGGISRDAYFSQINLCGIGSNLTLNGYCIINGIDRFLDVNGLPLSAEFDRFIEQLFEDAIPPKVESKKKGKTKQNDTNKHIKWLFLGSDRTRLYLERKRNLMSLEKSDTKPITPPCYPFVFHELGNGKATTGTNLASSYLQAIQDAMCKAKADEEKFIPSPSEQNAIHAANMQAHDRSGESRRLSIERLRRAFFDAYLETSAFEQCGMPPEKAKLAMEVLRALAFIGLPVEESVLGRVPRISQNTMLNDVLKTLLQFQLILRIEGFEDSTAPGVSSPVRYGLHRAVMAEIRFRLGLPLSEAKLSTAFNMSLYVAQPVDGYIPEPEIHEELGELIDGLISAYQATDTLTALKVNKKIKEDAKNRNPPFGFIDNPDNDDAYDSIIQKSLCRAKADYIACLRAALAVIRGYYTTTGLLTLDCNDRLISDDGDGILLEHAERLDNLIDAYGKTAELRDVLRDKMKEPDFAKAYSNAEPFYADELVWLHNERGVVRLAMGDLHEANHSFQTALTVNKCHVEYGDRSHNWRRVKLNQMTVEIERGELFAAERMIREVLESSGWPIDGRATSLREAEEKFEVGKSRKEENCKKCSEDESKPKHYFLQEDRLAIAIALGYRGMCANLRGEMLDAMDDLKLATELLRKLDEQRAFAYFTRLYAWALREVGQTKESDRQIDIAIDAAQSTRQMDLVYRSEIMRAQWSWEKPSATDDERRTAARTLTNALEYGVAAEMHRVRTEAASSLAKLKLKTGDHEVALQYTTEAMTIATRYNLRLRMMSVRVRLGEIMIKRGDRDTGRSLITGAIKAASRSGFQRVVDSGQQALDKS